MNRDRPRAKDLSSELVFTTSRSGGPGGQNVNKVNSKVTLSFDVAGSIILTESEKKKISKLAATRITNDGFLMLTASNKRSQIQNKEEVVQKLDKLLAKVFRPTKMRKATKPPASAERKRLEGKKKQSEKKLWRRRPD